MFKPMWLTDNGALSRDRREILGKDVFPLGSLQEVVRWGFALKPPANIAAVVAQDEFSHDVVLRPDADELLDARLARGWVAVPTSTVDGDPRAQSCGLPPHRLDQGPLKASREKRHARA